MTGVIKFHSGLTRQEDSRPSRHGRSLRPCNIAPLRRPLQTRKRSDMVFGGRTFDNRSDYVPPGTRIGTRWLSRPSRRKGRTDCCRNGHEGPAKAGRSPIFRHSCALLLTENQSTIPLPPRGQYCQPRPRRETLGSSLPCVTRRWFTARLTPCPARLHGDWEQTNRSCSRKLKGNIRDTEAGGLQDTQRSHGK